MKFSVVQRKVLAQKNGTHLIVSGAGTGCTEVIIHKALLYLNQGTIVDTIALLDCNASAYNLNKRLAALAGTESLKASTVDAFCRRQIECTIAGVIRDTAKKYAINEDALCEAYQRQALKQADCTLFELVQRINTRVEYYGLGGDEVDCSNAYEFFVKRPDLLKLCLRHHQTIIVDNFHNVTEQQATFLIQASKTVPFLLVGGDPVQSLQERGDCFPTYWEHFIKAVKPTHHYFVDSFRIGTRQALFTNAIAKDITGSGTVKSHRESTKPIYKSFLNSDQQYGYLQDTINTLVNSGVPASDIAILARTKAPLLNTKLVLNKHHIPTFDAFLYRGQVDESFAIMQALIGITRRVALNEEISESQLKLLIDFVGIKKDEQDLMVHCISKGGIGQLRVPRRHGRDQSDRLLVLRRAIMASSADAIVEAGVQRLINGIAPFIVDRYKNGSLLNGKLLVCLLSAVKLSLRYCFDWAEVNERFINLELSSKGVFLGTIYKSFGGTWKHVFVINVVDCYYPLLKYNKSSSDIESEQRLFYSAITRSSEQLYLLRTPVPKLHFKSKKGSTTNRIAHSNFTKQSRFIVDYKKYLTINKKQEFLVEEYYSKPTIF